MKPKARYSWDEKQWDLPTEMLEAECGIRGMAGYRETIRQFIPPDPSWEVPAPTQHAIQRTVRADALYGYAGNLNALLGMQNLGMNQDQYNTAAYHASQLQAANVSQQYGQVFGAIPSGLAATLFGM